MYVARRRLRGRPRYHGGLRGRPDHRHDLGPGGHQGDQQARHARLRAGLRPLDQRHGRHQRPQAEGPDLQRPQRQRGRRQVRDRGRQARTSSRSSAPTASTATPSSRRWRAPASPTSAATASPPTSSPARCPTPSTAASPPCWPASARHSPRAAAPSRSYGPTPSRATSCPPCSTPASRRAGTRPPCDQRAAEDATEYSAPVTSGPGRPRPARPAKKGCVVPALGDRTDTFMDSFRRDREDYPAGDAPPPSLGSVDQTVIDASGGRSGPYEGSYVTGWYPVASDAALGRHEEGHPASRPSATTASTPRTRACRRPGSRTPCSRQVVESLGDGEVTSRHRAPGPRRRR